MKAMIRIGVVILVIFLIGFYNGPSFQENEEIENEPFSVDSNENAEIPSSDGLTRPKSGVSVYIGQNVELLIEEYGNPERMDPGRNGLTWYIYKVENGYMQAAVKNDEVKALFVMGNAYDSTPYFSGQSVQDIYQFTMINSEIIVEDNGRVYQLELSEQDLHTRLLVQFEDIYAQLMIDSVSNNLMGVYYLDKETLLDQQPYEGSVEGGPLADQDQLVLDEVNEANERQMFDIVNFIRSANGLDELIWDDQLAEAARELSRTREQMSIESSGEQAGLSDRLEILDRDYKSAAENTASQYYLTPAVVHGWLNSESHRSTMLDDTFTHTGSGVYGSYFTQDFVQFDTPEEEEDGLSLQHEE
ncbi:CAP domain-containing protein [Jeotgalibacillus haloalkalitolerans]|uniref:CAP-associated domain-containing protein n=1 Tax=Jeotgalibacillus haloalkalitolerans TaxID=3104292 RepID=A0ABU5KK28_9BACL|nr:CAP-associated domain-containing protein [Jeotgalibacillus sp. HH7-29]MDZ5711535.1 CAP-associated domain-containing protein [Jeotgalibacillus sp. HH7-29]